MTYTSYLPFLAVVVTITRAASPFTTAKCPLPTRPTFLVADNQHHAYPDINLFNENSISLPLKCVSENYVLEEPKTSKCVDQKWSEPDYKCIALITLKRQVTKKIMIASGVVMGTIAAIFVIVKVILYKRQQKKGDKLAQSHDSSRIQRRANQRPRSWDQRPESKMVFENDAYVGYYDHEGPSSFEPRPDRTPGSRGSHVYSDIDLGSRYSGEPAYTMQRL